MMNVAYITRVMGVNSPNWRN